MKIKFIKIIILSFLLFGSCYFLANQAFARTSSSWEKVGSTGFGNGVVYTTAVYNNELYVGGSFTEVDGVTVGRVAKWNGSSWSRVGITGADGTVYTLKIYNDKLYAGGSFNFVDGIGMYDIAAWNGTSWSKVNIPAPEDTILTLEVYNNELYAGGHFGMLDDGTPARFIAKYNGSSWSAVGTTVTPGMGNSVLTLKSHDGYLYAGGVFVTADGIAANHVAKWNGSAWSAVSAQGTNGDVQILEVYNNELYAGGVFTTADGTTVNHIAKFGNSVWNAISTLGINNTVYSLAVYNNELYVGGDFTAVESITANRIAKWNGTSWSNAGTSGMNGTVRALGTQNDLLFSGGSFTTADGTTVNRFASWYIDITAPATTASPAGGTYTSDQVVTLTATDSDSAILATYYTTDGSTPTTSSTTYSSPISIPQNTTLKFFSVDSLGNTEEVKTETYVIDLTSNAQKKLRKGKKIYLTSNLDGEQISGQSLVINFTDLPSKLTKNSNYWIQLIKHKSYPGNLALGSHLSLKKYWLLKTNLNKYKPKKSSQKFKIKIAYKYTKKELNVLKNIEPSLPTKELRLKYRVKAGLNWYNINNNWTKAKTTHNLSKKKFTVKNFTKFPKNTYYFAIIKK